MGGSTRMSESVLWTFFCSQGVSQAPLSMGFQQRLDVKSEMNLIILNGQYFFSHSKEDTWGFWGGASGKEFTCHCRKCKKYSSIPGSGKSSGEATGNPLQYSCLGNPMDRGTWWATVHRITKSQTQLSD